MGDHTPHLADLPTPPGLCADCVHRRLVASKRSVFLLCGLAETDARFPRYPPLPVVECGGYRPAARGESG
jgi:hypothetical protein